MNTLKWTIGEVTIYNIVELEAGPLIQSIIKNATQEAIQSIDWLYPHFADESGNLKAAVQSFLIKSDGKNILIDGCNGNGKLRTDIPEWSNLRTDFLAKLGRLGMALSDIDIVACTHLHCDHVGWNTKLENGIWEPTFPKAQYLFAQEEYEYWKKKPEKEIADDKAAFDDSVSPIVKAGLAKLVKPDYIIDRNMSLFPTPGHTPCHVSVLVESLGQHAIISGDFLHHPCQIAYPRWTTNADTLPDKGIETRIDVLRRIERSDAVLIGSHFAHPVAGKVISIGDGFAFRTVEQHED